MTGSVSNSLDHRPQPPVQPDPRQPEQGRRGRLSPHRDRRAPEIAPGAASPASCASTHDAQHCASLFRRYCLENNLLDFSLQVGSCSATTCGLRCSCRAYLNATYRHLIVDNLEEDTPFAHDLLAEWLPEFDSALLIYDQRRRLPQLPGRRPARAPVELAAHCAEQHVFRGQPGLPARAGGLRPAPGHGARTAPPRARRARSAAAAGADHRQPHRFYPQMLDWVAAQVAPPCSTQGVPPGEIAVLAPLPARLAALCPGQPPGRALAIPYRSHRPRARCATSRPRAAC